MGLLNHQQLMIVKGVGKTPGDTASAEQDPIVIDFLDKKSAFSLVDWSPNIPSLKSGGVWADSAISDGRQLIAGQNTNVIETMTIQLTGVTCQAFAAQFAILGRMIADLRAMHDTFWQIEPVYLQWQAAGAPAPQYALIFNIDMKVTYQDSPQSQAELILTIEREEGWRGIKPGGNPKEWYYYSIGQPAQFNVNNATLLTGNAHLAVNTGLDNERSWTSTSFVAASPLNYMDVPADKIPGDMPALVELEVETVTSNANAFMIAVSSKPTTLTRRDGTTGLQSLIINSSDETVLGTDTTLVADSGASADRSGTRNRSRTTFATATMQTRLTFAPSTAAIDLSIMRGRYAVFLRSRLSAANTTVLLQYLIQSSGGGITFFTSNQYTLIDQGVGGTGNTTSWFLLYMGILELPLFSRVLVDGVGRGVQAVAPTATPIELLILLQASRSAGAGDLYTNDFILMPIDEAMISLQPIGQGSTTLSAIPFLYDNTGYMQHGKRDQLAIVESVVGGGEAELDAICEVRGTPLTLRPGVLNRIHFHAYNQSTLRSSVAETISARVNIVPRWRGIRDI